MANKIGLITKWSTEMFDEAYVSNARSSVLDANKGLLQFTGAKTVRFPKWNGEGLYNYNRANEMVNGKYVGQSTFAGTTENPELGKGYGYQQGDTNLVWEERTMRVDRAVQYRIDKADNEETQNKAVAFATGQINKQKIIPEIDAYAFSQIVYEACSEDLGNIIHAPHKIGDAQYKPLAMIDDAVEFLADNEVEVSDLIGFTSNAFKKAMRQSKEVTRVLRPKDFSDKIDFAIDDYDGIPFVDVPARRFYTNVVLGPGSFYPGEDSERIDLLIVSKSCVYHVVKYNTIKVFGPEVVQDYDGYKINARIYHDIFVPDNKKIGVYCILTNSGETTPLKAAENKLAVRTIPGKVANSYIVDSVTTVPGSLYYNQLYAIPGTTKNVTVGTNISTQATAVAIEPYETVIEDTETQCVFAITDASGVILACTKEAKLNKKGA